MRTIHTRRSSEPLGDGIRAAGPADFGALVELHDRLDALTVLSRHLTPHPDLSAAHIAGLLDTDGRHRAAFVTEHGGRVTGFGRYVRQPGTTTGEALVLADAEGRAAGDEERLVAQLAAAARRAGLTRLAMEVLPIDRGFLDLVDDSSLPFCRHLHCGAVNVTLDLSRLTGEAGLTPLETSTSGGGSP